MTIQRDRLNSQCGAERLDETAAWSNALSTRRRQEQRSTMRHNIQVSLPQCAATLTRDGNRQSRNLMEKAQKVDTCSPRCVVEVVMDGNGNGERYNSRISQARDSKRKMSTRKYAGYYTIIILSSNPRVHRSFSRAHIVTTEWSSRVHSTALMRAGFSVFETFRTLQQSVLPTYNTIALFFLETLVARTQY